MALIPVQIVDNGNLLRIVRGTRTLDIPKSNANVLLTSPTAPSLFITGDDGLINEEIVFAEVTLPVSANITALRDAINNIINSNFPPLNRFLDTNGDTTGSINGAANFAVATEFFIRPAVGQIFDIYQLIVYIQDSGNLDSGRYGNNITLANGIIIQTVLGTVVRILTAGQPIFINAGYTQHTGRTELNDFGMGDGAFEATFDMVELLGLPLRLVGDSLDRLGVILEDNFSGLNVHTFKITGRQS